MAAGLRRICESANNVAVKERLGALRNTLVRLSNGERVAYRAFYERAGVEPPATGGASEETKTLLARIEGAVADPNRWRGRAELTQQKVLLAVIGVAKEFGRPVEGGVSVDLSTRDLAVKASVERKAVMRSLDSLIVSGALLRFQAEKRTHGDTFVIPLS